MVHLNRGHELLGQRIDNGRLELLSILGVGAYGVVYLAREQCNAKTRKGNTCPCQGGNYAPHGQQVAVKCMTRKGLEPRQLLYQRREVTLHSLATSYSGIATLHRVFEERDYIFLVMDYLEGGDLFSMISDRQRYKGNDELIRSVFLQIIDTVAYCHSMGIYHRDLKPENILCSGDGTRVVLTDFGLATTEAMTTDFGCGSPFYLSPECQGGLDETYEAYSSSQADLWSLGVLLANLVCTRNPWHKASLEDETFRAYWEDRNVLGRVLPISPSTEEILAGCFAKEPSDRLSLAHLRRLVLAAPKFSRLPPPSKHRVRVDSMPITPISPPIIDPPIRYPVGPESQHGFTRFDGQPSPPLSPIDSQVVSIPISIPRSCNRHAPYRPHPFLRHPRPIHHWSVPTTPPSCSNISPHLELPASVPLYI